MKAIYIDDEEIAIVKFKLTAEKIEDLSSIAAFTSAADGIEYVRSHKTDIAFLDMEMPETSGIEVARQMKEIDPDIRIIFVTAYDNYALAAFDVDAIGYVMKPYTMEKLEKEVKKAGQMHGAPHQKVYIQTMPNFEVFVDGKLVPISRKKAKEFLALLVDRRGSVVTPGQAISVLWEDRPDDDSTKALFRMTVKRLKDVLDEEGIGFILELDKSCRAIKTSEVECDLYQFLNGDEKGIRKYQGEYMSEYSWAEETNAKLYETAFGFKDE